LERTYRNFDELRIIAKSFRYETNVLAFYGTSNDKIVLMFLPWGSTKAKPHNQAFAPKNIYALSQKKVKDPAPSEASRNAEHEGEGKTEE
jgi:hypothetical protein